MFNDLILAFMKYALINFAILNEKQYEKKNKDTIFKNVTLKKRER